MSIDTLMLGILTVCFCCLNIQEPEWKRNVAKQRAAQLAGRQDSDSSEIPKRTPPASEEVFRCHNVAILFSTLPDFFGIPYKMKHS